MLQHALIYTYDMKSEQAVTVFAGVFFLFVSILKPVKWAMGISTKSVGIRIILRIEGTEIEYSRIQCLKEWQLYHIVCGKTMSM